MSDVMMQALGHLLAEARKQSGKTQEEVGKSAFSGTNYKQQLSNIERGKTFPPLYSIPLLADSLGVEKTWLFEQWREAKLRHLDVKLLSRWDSLCGKKDGPDDV